MSRRRLIALVALGVAATIAFHRRTTDARWQILTDDFVRQLNSLGASLEPGGTGTIRISAPGADELIFLPPYSSVRDLREHLADRPNGFIERLSALSGDDRSGPAFIWLRDGAILSINYSPIEVGLNGVLHSWKLRGPRDVRVQKESQSRNQFLSLDLLDD